MLRVRQPLLNDIGGGGSFNASFSESLSASDTTSATLAASAAVAEVISASDTVSATLATTASFSEALSASDSFSCTLAASASISEILSVTDSFNGTQDITGNVSESLSSSDSFSATATSSASFSEALSAADSFSCTLSSTASISEALSASDSFNGTQDIVGSIAEALNATDSFSATLTASASISEVLNAFDSFDRSAEMSVNITESLNASDTFKGRLPSTGGATVDEIFNADLSLYTTPGTFGAAMNSLLAEVAAIKAKTDQFVFTIPNQVDSNAITGGSSIAQQDIRDAMKLAPSKGQPADGSIDNLCGGRATGGAFINNSSDFKNIHKKIDEAVEKLGESLKPIEKEEAKREEFDYKSISSGIIKEIKPEIELLAVQSAELAKESIADDTHEKEAFSMIAEALTEINQKQELELEAIRAISSCERELERDNKYEMEFLEMLNQNK